VSTHHIPGTPAAWLAPFLPIKKNAARADIPRCEGDLAKQTAIERKRALALWMWEQLTR